MARGYWFFRNGFLGLGKRDPKVELDVLGDVSVSGALTVAGSPVSGGGLGLASVGSTPADAGASVSGNTLTLQPADATHPGVLTSGTQTVAGAKTFTSKITLTGGTQSTGGIGGGFAAGYGIHFPDSDNTIYHRSGSVAGGGHNFGDLSGTSMGRLSTDGFHLDSAALAVWLQYTDSTGTPGDAVINKASGRSAIASGHTTCVITSSVCTTTSVVLIAPEDGSNTVVWWTVTPGSGSFTVTVKTDPGATWKFRWAIFKGE